MLGRERTQLTFGQVEARRRVGEEHFLRKMDKAVNWRPMEQLLEGLYTSRRGRPSYPPLVMFKALLLQQWYGLSDPGLEEAIGDRISFQQFLGLSFEDSVPDETTICKFRGMLARKGLSEKLFDLVSEQLKAKGLVVRRGSLIDATLLSAQRRPGGDPDASTVKRGDKVHYGYKAHVTVDQGSEIVRKMELTSASVHESPLFYKMLQGDERSVFADKAYFLDVGKSRLRRWGIFCGILDKSKKNRPLSFKQKKRNKRLSRIRSAVERVFGTFKSHYGMRRVRYVGLIRNKAHLFLVGICYNLKKLLVLKPA